jgi:hypothetical protein
VTTKSKYTTQLQAGLGLLQETRMLLRTWEPGMRSPALYQAALRSGEFPNVSARRLLNIIRECFAPRYLLADGPPARYLKPLVGALAPAELNQLLFLHTCRANQILADFVRELFWERYAAGDDKVTVDEAKAFVLRGVDDGKTAKRWSDSTVKRVTSYLLGCATDYGLLGKRTLTARLILPYRIEVRAAAYLAHDLHFAGLGDNALLTHPDWQLFGLTREDVRDELKRLSLRGQFILQSAGDVTHIGWKHKTMEDLVGVIAEG